MDNQKNHFKSFSTYSQYEEYKAKVLNVPYVIYIEDNKEYIYSYSEEPLIDYELKHFTIQALESGDFVITEPQSRFNYFKYSINDGEWVDFTEIETTLTLSENDTISISSDCDYFLRKIINTSCKFNVYGNIMSLIFGDNFVGKTSLCGFPRSFSRLFYGCTTLISAKNLILPATTLSEQCYECMFEDCTLLVEAPELPATTLASECYVGMFHSCSSLVSAPILPTTTLSNGCYNAMFYGCTSLVNAPELPATTLTYGCYRSMFGGCTSLVNTPELPATVLTNSCYDNMFSGCSNLNKVTMLATDISATDCLTNWLSGVSETGTFVKESGVMIPNGPSGIPEGWNVVVFGGDKYFTIEVLESGSVSFGSKLTGSKYSVNDSEWVEITSPFTLNVSENDTIRLSSVSNDMSGNPFSVSCKYEVYGNIMSLLFGDDFVVKTSLEGYDKCFNGMFKDNSTLVSAKNLILPATTLANRCYYAMFYGCASLVNTPKLPATTLGIYCYKSMFDGCTSLVEAPELPATTLAESCYEYMFFGCTSLVSVPELPATTLESYCYKSMFNGCTSLVNASELPATTLTSECYRNMFSGCTSLVEAPELPATTLSYWCYRSMFDGCTSLVNAPELPATTLATSCYESMFSGCTSLVEAPELPATTLASDCYYGMFKGCTSLVEAPELPATTLKSTCYNSMFNGCTNLNKVTMLATDISASNCLDNWLSGVPYTGTFIKESGVSIPRGSSGIPYGWYVEEV